MPASWKSSGNRYEGVPRPRCDGDPRWSVRSSTRQVQRDWWRRRRRRRSRLLFDVAFDQRVGEAGAQLGAAVFRARQQRVVLDVAQVLDTLMPVNRGSLLTHWPLT